MKRILRDILVRWLRDRRYEALDLVIAGLLGLALGLAWMVLVLLKGGVR